MHNVRTSTNLCGDGFSELAKRTLLQEPFVGCNCYYLLVGVTRVNHGPQCCQPWNVTRLQLHPPVFWGLHEPQNAAWSDYKSCIPPGVLTPSRAAVTEWLVVSCSHCMFCWTHQGRLITQMCSSSAMRKAAAAAATQLNSCRNTW